MCRINRSIHLSQDGGARLLLKMLTENKALKQRHVKSGGQTQANQYARCFPALLQEATRSTHLDDDNLTAKKKIGNTTFPECKSETKTDH